METCCKVNLGVGAVAADCSDDKLSGLRDLRVALLCYVVSTTENIAPDVYVSDVVMKTTANDPTNGDDEHLFYHITTKEKTLEHTFSWTCNEDTDARVYEETVSGEVPVRNPRAFHVLRSWMCKDVVVLGREPGLDGGWIMVGLGGGLKLRTVEGGTGVQTTDNNNTTISFTGDDLQRPWLYVFNTDVATTDTLVDSITSAAV